MIKHFHEFRDPVYNFVKLETDERSIVDSVPVQRLRSVHQLALEYLLYPGATHKRFEHSLGVMHLSGRVFESITRTDRRHPEIVAQIPELTNERHLANSKMMLRAAGLCHDVGHPPFSHAAEELFSANANHEDLTVAIIDGPAMADIWTSMVSAPLRPRDVAKLAVGTKILNQEQFTNWQAILSEIIVGDAFGVDRIDYLLRDSLHAGVAYGKFDYERLIESLWILPKQYEPDSDGTSEPALGVEEGGLHSAEALLLARYFMFT
ncbi:MAG: HD domain-containing protein [Chloroflexi bacterium]|nr:HD domain-containing protein [Chloroflexota bacterium]